MEQIWNQIVISTLAQALTWLQGIAGSYGGAIVLLAILVKLVALPFAFWQTRQSRLIAELQPEIEALRRQYANDQAGFNERQMKLYQQHGINLFGGCLLWPLVIALTLGLWVGLYQVVRATSEARAGFLWLPSLALPNGWPIPEPRLSYLALPLLTLVVLLIQRRVSAASGVAAGLPIGRAGWFGPLIIAAVIALLPAGLALFGLAGGLFDLLYMAAWGRRLSGRQADPARLQAQLQKAERLEQARPDAARRGYLRLVRVVESARSPSGEARRVQAQAYLRLGGLDETARQDQEAVANYRKAGALGLPEARLRLAPLLARQGKSDSEAEGVYLEYLRARRGVARTNDDVGVVSALEQLCRVAEDANAAQMSQATSRNQAVIEADPSLAWAHFFLGLAYLLSGRHQQASAALEEARRLDPARSETYLYLGRSYLALARHDAAIEAFQASLERNPRQPAVALQLGKLALEPLLIDPRTLQSRDGGQRFDLALKWLRQATELDRTQEEAFYYLGRAELLQQAYTKAAQAFQQAVALDGRRKESFYHMALAQQAAGADSQAIAAVEKAIALDSNYAEAHSLLADLLFAERVFQRAVKHYRETLRLNRDNQSAHRYLGRCLYELGEYSQAIGELTGVAAHFPDALFYLARSQAKLRQFDAAIASLRQLARGSTPDADTFYYLGCAYANAGQAGRSGAFDAALAAFAECLQIAPGHWEAHVQMGHIYLQRDQVVEARQHYLQAQAIEPRSPAVLYAQGMLAWVDGNLPQAQALLQQSLRQAPDHAPSLLALGAIYEQQGDMGGALRSYRSAGALGSLGVLLCKQKEYAEAKQQLLQAKQTGDQRDAVLNALGFSQAMLKEYKDALRTWSELYERHPEDERLALNITRLHYVLGSEHARAGRYSEAADEWERCLTLYSEDDQLRGALAEIYFRKGRADLRSGGAAAAKQALLRASELCGPKSGYEYYLALSELAAEEHEAAGERLRRLMDADSGHAGYTYHFGLTLLNQGQSEAARALFEQVAAGAKGELARRARWAMAALDMRAGQWDAAAEMFQAA